MPCLKHGHRHFRWLLAPSHITCCHILDAVQGSILRCYLHGRSIGYFISQKWNLKLCGVVQPVAWCWACGTPGPLSPSESASNSSSWQTFFFFFQLKKFFFGHAAWHVGSQFLNRNRTYTPCIGSAESQPLDHQNSLLTVLMSAPLTCRLCLQKS